jgi:hypothetical protein
MTTSTLELGPEILDTFIPTDYLLDGNPGIATIPGNDEEILRWLPHVVGNANQHNEDATAPVDQTILCGMPEALASMCDQGDEEFGYVSDCGIRIPQPGLDIVRFIGDGSRVGLHGSVEYSLVRRYHGEILDKCDPRGIPLVEGYALYLQGAASRGQVLYDLCRASQHMICDDNKVPILLDMEKRVAKTTTIVTDSIISGHEKPKKETAIKYAARQLCSWFVALDMRGANMDAVHDLASA